MRIIETIGKKETPTPMYSTRRLASLLTSSRVDHARTFPASQREKEIKKLYIKSEAERLSRGIGHMCRLQCQRASLSRCGRRSSPVYTQFASEWRRRFTGHCWYCICRT